MIFQRQLFQAHVHYFQTRTLYAIRETHKLPQNTKHIKLKLFTNIYSTVSVDEVVHDLEILNFAEEVLGLPSNNSTVKIKWNTTTIRYSNH